MGFPTCLIGRQHHAIALSALGVAPDQLAFPAVVSCPLCQKNTLHLFDDSTTNGIWLYCNSCLAHGDIITFGAALWNTTPAAAVARFIELTALKPAENDNPANEYARVVERFEKFEQFWFDAEAQIWGHHDDVIACRLQELGVYPEINAAGLVGVAYKEQIDSLQRFVRRPLLSTVRENGASLVFPYYDLPGRLTGFLVVQYDEKFTAKQNFIALNQYRRGRPEAGYFLLRAALLPATEPLKSTQFVVDDPMWALSMQCEMLRRGLTLLPVMASYTGVEANSWGGSWCSFNPVPRIFQSHTVSPELISRAANARGYVAVVAQNQRLKNRLATDAMSRLVSIRKNAETWQTRLTSALGQMSEIAAHSFATRLTIPTDKLVPFLTKIGKNFSPGFADRVLTHVKTSKNITPAVPQPWQRTVIPKTDGWWSVTNHHICDANIVINKITQADDGEKTYTGTIYLDGAEIPFTDDAGKIERAGLLAYAAGVVAGHKKVMLYDSRWNSRSHLIAIGLSKPELVCVSNRLGWDERASVFRFANYELAADGTPSAPIQPGEKNKHAIFPEPVIVAPPAIRQFLTPSPENAFVWAVVATVTANLIAPVLRREPVATGTTSAGFPAAAGIAAALGCRHQRIDILRRASASAAAYARTADLEWPVTVASVFDAASLSPTIPRCHNRPALVCVTPTTATVAPTYGWQIITGSADPKSDFSPLAYVLPAYIQRALRQRMRISLTNSLTALAVLEDMYNWLRETYDAAFQLEYARNHLITQNEADTAFFAELRAAVLGGALAVLPRPRKVGQPGNYIVRKKTHWWLNQHAIDRYFYDRKAIAPNWVWLVKLLTHREVFGGEEAVRNMPGILVDTDWCDQYLLPAADLARDTG
jgi:hypothetical protein